MIRTNGKGEAYYMCPRCNKLYKITGIDKPIPNYFFEERDGEGYPVGYYDVNFDVRCFCDSTHKTQLVNIDPNIAREIVIMNRKGYKTYFCCEGHDDKFDVCSRDFYVAFSIHKNQLEKVLDFGKEIPKDWVLKREYLSGFANKRGDRGLVLCVFMGNWFKEFSYSDKDENEFIYGEPISSKEYEKKKKRYLKEFKEIVKSLPNLSLNDFNNRVPVIEFKVKSI